jgi:hypothetical protein
MNKCGVVHEKLACSKVDPFVSRIAPLGHPQTYHQLKCLIYKGKLWLYTENSLLYYYLLHIKRINNSGEKQTPRDWKTLEEPSTPRGRGTVLARILKDNRTCQRKAPKLLADCFPVPLILSRSLNP